jgi:mono/diheme cytochrome c family protein
MKQEFLARIILCLLVAAAGLAGVLAVGLPTRSARAAYEIHARMPENGGWSVETLTARVGEPLRLRLTSDDVLHSFAIGKLGAEPLELLPGEWVEMELVFEQPGRYTFYCTRWCGKNHWRMRGVIEVGGPGLAFDADVAQPLYLALGLDVDAPHPAQAVPARLPSAVRGAALEGRLPAWALDRAALRQAGPAETYLGLRAEAGLADLEDADLWDVVAYLYTRQAPGGLDEAQALFAANCAACHGEAGRGDGVMVADLPAFEPPMGQMRQTRPPDFTDPRVLLGASPALLEGKLLRGGMGTGMPYWGPILTEEQINALIAYLYSFPKQR